MRIRTRITFWCKDIEKARRILEPFGFEANIVPNVNIHAAEFFVDQKEYSEFLEVLSRHDIEHDQVSELRTMSFDDNELAEAMYLRMAPAGYWGYPQPEEDFDLYRQESYDVSAKCNLCGNGSIQNRPLLVKGKPRFGRNDILAIHWEYEYIVTDRLRSLVEKERFTGVDFWPILDYKRRTPIQGYHQVHITNVLPPMSHSTQFEFIPLERLPKNPCSCGRAGRNLALHQMVYKRRDLATARDFNKTHEWLGGGYGTTQWKVVSQRVFGLFRDNGLKRVSFEPVIVEE